MKPETWRRQRHPFSRLALLASAAVLGIGSRRFAARLPGFVASYAGDTLWALAAFLGIGILFPKASTKRVAVLALLVSLLVEISQLSKAPWLESIRRTPIGGLILGYDFVWSDLACYAIGVILGVTIEVAWTPLARPTRMRQADIEGRDDPGTAHVTSWTSSPEARVSSSSSRPTD